MKSQLPKGIHILRSPVILSIAGSARSAVAAKSKDPVFACISNRLRREFSRGFHSARSLVAIALLLTSLASAQTLTGNVKNSTTGKPSAGDDVILLSLGQGMEEAGRTKSDAKGNFSFKLDSSPGPHLVRVVHQEVTYHRMAPPGTTSVQVEVYDVGKKVEGISVIADIMRFQAGQGQLQVERTFAVNNTSKPPRTQMNEHNLEFYVPDGATIAEGQAMTAGGQPVNSAPVPEGANAKNRYAFLFPLRPGETRFSVVYTVPYTGSVNIDPKSVYPLEHFVVIAPKSIQFAAASGAAFTVAPYPGQPDANVQVASNTQLGQALAFKLSGEGMLAAQGGGGGEDGAPPSQGAQTQPESRPGGGLGPPIDAPPPYQKYQWYILGGLALALVIGAVYVASRQQATNRVARIKGKALPEFEDDEEYEPVEAFAVREGGSGARSSTSARGNSSMLLEALKEELFQLEVDYQQGRMTQQEYDSAKSALDQTLQRALKREAQKA